MYNKPYSPGGRVNSPCLCDTSTSSSKQINMHKNDFYASQTTLTIQGLFCEMYWNRYFSQFHHDPHRAPRDNQYDRQQNAVEINKHESNVNACLGTASHGSSCSQTGIYSLCIYSLCTCLGTVCHGSNWSVASCSQTDIYSLLLLTDFRRACCSLSLWLSLGNQCDTVTPTMCRSKSGSYILCLLFLFSSWWSVFKLAWRYYVFGLKRAISYLWDGICSILSRAGKIFLAHRIRVSACFTCTYKSYLTHVISPRTR